jgi:GDPmannose 4,6-dehydratase
MRALIIGITGQDGSYLSELLLEKGYTVFGLIRRSSSINTGRIDHIFSSLHLRYGDVSDLASIIAVVKEATDNLNIEEGEMLEIYNLAAQSHVAISFQLEKYTADVDATGVLNVLQSIRLLNLENKVKLYQASTSELYGNTLNTHSLKVLNEDSPMNPVSPYAIAKLYAYHMVKCYRHAYKLFCVNGILFNHTSPRRGHNFVCKKICDYVRRFKENYELKENMKELSKNSSLVNGIIDLATYCEDLPPLQLGNLNATRDFGHAKDYVRGMWLILQQTTPQDYVLATQHRVTIRKFVELAFKQAGFDGIYWENSGINEKGYLPSIIEPVVEVNEKYFRPYDLTDLLGDSTKAHKELNWVEEYKLEDIIKEMIN